MEVRHPPRSVRVPRRRRAARIARLLGATLTVVVLALVMSGVGLYFLLQGQAVENSAITREVERRVQELIGARYTVELGSTTVGLDANGLLSLSSSDVAIRRAGEEGLVSSVGRVVLGLRLMSVLRGEPQIDAIIVEDTALHAGLLPLPQSEPPADVAGLLDTLHAGLARIETQFARTGFRLFEIRRATVEGLALGRAEAGPVVIEDLEIRHRRNAVLTASGLFRTSQSDIALEAEWSAAGEEGRTFEVIVDGLSSREWAADPDGDTGQFGLDALVSAHGLFPYSADGVAGEPTIALRLGESTLRIGSEATTSIKSASLNLRLSPVHNRIELDESFLEADGMKASLRGGVAPDGSKWIGEPLRFEIAASPVIREPTVAGEQPAPLSGKATGRWLPDDRRLSVEEARLLAGSGEVVAEADFRFEAGKTPAIRATATGRMLDVAAVKQAWPFFLAPPARLWAFSAISGGRVVEMNMSADLPPNVFGRFRNGAKMTPEQYRLVARFEGVRLRTFGELPFIENAAGEFAVRGMAVEAELGSGHVSPAPGRKLPLEVATYRVADFAVRPNPAEVRISAEGDLRDLAVLAQSRPLEVMSRINISPAAVTGSGDADVVARFPVKRGLTYDEVEWNAIVNLADAASSDKIFDRKVEKATLQVFATRDEVQIKGKAALDGVMTDLAMTEPIGGSGVAGERRIATVLDEAQRKKLGLVLDPVLTGKIRVEMEQQKDGPQKQTVHLDDAEMLLPWIGWSKGKGVGGKATYVMRSENGQTRLDDFYVEGPGFSAAGRIALDKNGLRQADFTDISLNDGDSFGLKLERKGKTYHIEIEGLRYDARSLINKIFHEKGFAQGKSDTDVVVSASLGEVRGFNGQILKGLQLSYATAGGRFDGLSLRGSFTDATNVRIYAATKEGRTQFEIDASEAGGTLAFIDIYGRMRGGDLRARLSRSGDGPFTGPVRATNFVIEGEPRIAALVSEPVQAAERGANIGEIETLRRIEVQRVRFQEARGSIEKGETYLRVSDGIFNNNQIGLTFDGIVFDKSDRMDLVGTFLPAIGLSRAIGSIPFVGEILGNGRDSGLIGMTFRLSGPMRNPQIEVNPMSLVAPGVFRRVFEFRN